MKIKSALYILLALTGLTACGLKQSKNNMQSNPLICDPETGICEIPGEKQDATSADLPKTNKPMKVIYFTDPICSSCWGIEPQLRKLKLEYGAYFDIEYRMGGLLPDWSYNSGGISKPSDVAHHWDEVSVHYDMPIDGDVWLEDPLDSSYPPSIAFKAAQMQDEEKAIEFLREIREMVFLQKKNITKWEYLKEAAQNVGLDTTQFKTDYEGKATSLFQADLKLGREMGVRGFPSMFFQDSVGNRQFVYGTKPYSVYETAIEKLMPELEKRGYDHSWQYLFKKFGSLTANEYSQLSGIERNEAESSLNTLTQEGKLRKVSTKNGAIWYLN
ncbi:DsbA family protein [bacterium]|nr:DsbA family protein [bacterium]